MLPTPRRHLILSIPSVDTLDYLFLSVPPFATENAFDSSSLGTILSTPRVCTPSEHCPITFVEVVSGTCDFMHSSHNHGVMHSLLSDIKNRGSFSVHVQLSLVSNHVITANLCGCLES